jgi:imidazolonepropionase-like amidohydrolase
MSGAGRTLIVLAAPFLWITVTAQQPLPNLLAFTHAAVIDVAAGRVLPDTTVIVRAGRISAVGKSGTLRVPKGAQTVDASGKFLIPGLWDMHVHISDEQELPLYVANGVTGVRDMWGLPVHHEWRMAVESGSLTGPRMVIGSRIVDGPVPIWAGSLSVRNEAEAREAVRRSKAEGAEFIKTYELLPREAFFALADESKKEGLSFAGHVPQLVSAGEAADAGMKSMEHLEGILQASSSRETELRNATRAKLADRRTNSEPRFSPEERRLIRDSFSLEKEEALLKHLKAKGTWQTPTLVELRNAFVPDVKVLQSDPRLKYIPASLKSSWAEQVDLSKRSPDVIAFVKWRYERALETVGLMRVAGIELLAGSDVRNPYCMPGFGLHDELALLVQAGLTPAEALRSATLNPARFLRREAEMGTIAQGKIADLVLLDGNPLQDIRNTTKINAVVFDGRLSERAALERMLSQAEAAAKASGAKATN